MQIALSIQAVSFLVCIIGLLIYCFTSSDQAKAQTIGLKMFWVGLLAFLLRYSL